MQQIKLVDRSMKKKIHTEVINVRANDLNEENHMNVQRAATHERKIVIQCYVTWAQSSTQIKRIEFLIGNYYIFCFVALFVSAALLLLFLLSAEKKKKRIQMNHGCAQWLCACMCVV